LKKLSEKEPQVATGAFVFCERDSGAVQFQVQANPNGALPVEQAASMLAMHCLVRGQMPCDFIMLAKPAKDLFDTVGRRADELLKAGWAIRCERTLTTREREVLDYVLRSLSNKEIAGHLNVSERTVKFHVSALLAKFNVTDRFSLIRRAIGDLRSAALKEGSLFGFSMNSSKQQDATAQPEINADGRREMRLLRGENFA
jgi:DNA-binding NarL/FixJ family response regulator